MKKTIAMISALAMMTAMAVPMGVFAEDTTKTLDKATGSGTTEVSYDVASTYTITIPAGVTLSSDTDETATIGAAANLMLEAGKSVVVKLTGATNTSSGPTFNAKNSNETSTATYTIKSGNNTIGLGESSDYTDVVATFGTSTQAQTQELTFSKAENATYAGEHTEQLTFTISVE